jgi:hypothetical protein
VVLHTITSGISINGIDVIVKLYEAFFDIQSIPSFKSMKTIIHKEIGDYGLWFDKPRANGADSYIKFDIVPQICCILESHYDDIVNYQNNLKNDLGDILYNVKTVFTSADDDLYSLLSIIQCLIIRHPR